MIKLFKTVDEKFKDLGFIKFYEGNQVISYRKEIIDPINNTSKILHEIVLAYSTNGKHMINSYDHTSEAPVGLTMYEAQLCLKKMKQKGWEIVKDY